MGGMISDDQISWLIRKIIFESFNDLDTKFTNDQILDMLHKNNDVAHSWTTAELEPHITHLCDCGLVRNIAQNLNTVWLKLFDLVEKVYCNTCHHDVYVGATTNSTQRTCPRSTCGAVLS